MYLRAVISACPSYQSVFTRVVCRQAHTVCVLLSLAESSSVPSLSSAVCPTSSLLPSDHANVVVCLLTHTLGFYVVMMFGKGQEMHLFSLTFPQLLISASLTVWACGCMCVWGPACACTDGWEIRGKKHCGPLCLSFWLNKSLVSHLISSVRWDETLFFQKRFFHLVLDSNPPCTITSICIATKA